MNWFEASPERGALLDLSPKVSGRYSIGSDVQNAFILDSSLHDFFDSFDFSVWPDGDELNVYAFRPLGGGVKHGDRVRKPPINPSAKDPEYFRNLFPDKAVFFGAFRASGIEQHGGRWIHLLRI
ncbi:hypothetical protein BDK51DRAFT_34841 [Blyttiomyces helicus]|uniref:Uncharacterized protein n=1 Tax=Blyttiomyces helicus TaxID=388810 RepID=A0A4P9WS96_9FUNG|nr:hypothetical protein BDK51DRAFT_34841 [Blyttiomyces helicus]|eukprot:RKO94170.1 hypothetical protein BDK51DRAFT_34841 [Blyttiomyces helicus]